MNTNNTHPIPSTHPCTRTGAWLPTLVGLALTVASTASALAGPGTDNRAPEVPPDIAVDDAVFKVHFHGFAQGVQIYTWNGNDWGNAVPRATLFDEDGNVVVSHFGTTNGPAWRSNSGSEVVGKLPPKRADVDPENAIPWLLLEANATLTHGPGVLAGTKLIHRVNTLGGLAPKVAGTAIGQVAEVPYIADYFFYRATNQTNN
jgi:hypothetical protein